MALAQAQASALMALARAPLPPSHGLKHLAPDGTPMSSSPSSSTLLPSDMLGTEDPSFHADYSALMLEEWVAQYQRERANFSSVSLFCELKLQELLEVTAGLSGRSGPPGMDAAAARAAPSKVRTAVCIDIMDMMIGSILHTDKAAGAGGGGGDTAGATADSSRQSLGLLLLRLRDELVRSIYVQPMPSHLLLHSQLGFNRTAPPATNHSHPHAPSHPAPPQGKRRAGQAAHQLGSVTARSSRHLRQEEKSLDDTFSGSHTHRARLHSTAALSTTVAPVPAFPSSLSSLLSCTPWFSLLPLAVARNRTLSAQARLVLLPSNLFRLRETQKRVVEALIERGRRDILCWKFAEWRMVTAQHKEDRRRSRASQLASFVTDRLALLNQKLQLSSWRHVVLARKYGALQSIRAKVEEAHQKLRQELGGMLDETSTVREQIDKLSREHQQLMESIATLEKELDHTRVDLQDASVHQSQCAELLLALRTPLEHCFRALESQMASFDSPQRHFCSVAPLLATVVDGEYQAILEPLGGPPPPLGSMRSDSVALLPLTDGSVKQRQGACAQLVARWIALQLKLSTRVLSGCKGSYNAYLVKPENQMRLNAALARVRQLSSAHPPSMLPPFPAPAPAAPASSVVPPFQPKLPPSLSSGLPPLPSPMSSPRNGGVSLRGRRSLGVGSAAAAAAGAPPASPSLSLSVPGEEDMDSPGPLPSPSSAGEGGMVLTGGEIVLSSPMSSPTARARFHSSVNVTRVASRLWTSRRVGVGGGGGGGGSGLNDPSPLLPTLADLSRLRRMADARIFHSPPGTISSPLRLFASLRDQDRHESVLAASATLMLADGDVAGSLKQGGGGGGGKGGVGRWDAGEEAAIANMKSCMASLDLSPATMGPAQMEQVVSTLTAGMSASTRAQTRARQAARRLRAVEDEVFAQSLRQLRVQCVRRQKAGGGLLGTLLDREHEAPPSDALELDLAALADAFEASASAGVPTKQDIQESNKVMEEHVKDLFKIFTFYVQTGGSNNADSASSLLQSLNIPSSPASNSSPRSLPPPSSAATAAGAPLQAPGSLRMGEQDFQRFVREGKMKLTQLTMVETVFRTIVERERGTQPSAAAAAAGAGADKGKGAGSEGSEGKEAERGKESATPSATPTKPSTPLASPSATLMHSLSGTPLSPVLSSPASSRLARRASSIFSLPTALPPPPSPTPSVASASPFDDSDDPSSRLPPRSLSFRGFGEAIVRLALGKFVHERLLARKIRNMLLGHVLPNAAARAHAWHKAQAAQAAQAAQNEQAALAHGHGSAAAAGIAGAGGGGVGGVGGVVSAAMAAAAPGSSGSGSLLTVEVDAVCRKHHALLKQVFLIYARISNLPGSQGVGMTFNDVLGFAREFELLHRYVTQHDLKQLFAQCFGGAVAGDVVGAASTGSLGSDTLSTSSTSSSSSLSSPSALALARRQSMLTSMQASSVVEEEEEVGGMGSGGGGGSSAPVVRELTFRQFLELLAALSHYVVRNPYLAPHDRVDKFVQVVLASRKKMPVKVYRSAV